jgi:hypothetical protein
MNDLKRLMLCGPVLLAGCGAPPAADRPAPDPPHASPPIASEVPPTAGGDVVRLRVDGIEWSADRDFFCAVNPPGLDRGVIVSASRGPKDANEQTFNLNLSGIEGPGTLRLESSASLTHTIQLANLDGERFLNGGAMGFDVTVELLAVSSEPAHVEARFSGTLGSSAGRALRIEDGFVRCTE